MGKPRRGRRLGRVAHGDRATEGRLMPRAKKPRRGRPALGADGLSHPLTIKVTPAQRERWALAAANQEIGLGEFVREACDLAVARGSTR